MKRQEKANRIGEILDELYPPQGIVPPLDHADAYTLLVAVMLSAQTTDERVNLVTPALFALADNAADMADVAVEDILEA
ncbi:MAG: endonuclease III, partial [Myxococcota bacterium]